MKLKLISCEVFSRPAYHAAATSPHTVDIEFTKLRSHTNPVLLREEIQQRVDQSQKGYDAILLGFGLCGNSTAGIQARSVPLVIPRAHDCCTIFLGSRESFLKHFGQTPSAQWYTACYYERLGDWYQDYYASVLLSGDGGENDEYTKLVEKYGEENAQYIWETMKPKHEVDFLTYIDLPGFEDPKIREAFIKYAKESGKDTRFIKGGTGLIEKLISGNWNEDEFLVVAPGSEIKPLYDHNQIMGV